MFSSDVCTLDLWGEEFRSLEGTLELLSLLFSSNTTKMYLVVKSKYLDMNGIEAGTLCSAEGGE